MSASEKKPRWTSPHGRWREVERVIRATPELGGPAKTLAGALLQALWPGQVETAHYDEELAVRCGVKTRQSISAARAALQASGVVAATIGRPGRKTSYDFSRWLCDAFLHAQLEALDERLKEVSDEIEADRPRRSGVKKSLRRKPVEIGPGEAAIDALRQENSTPNEGSASRKPNTSFPEPPQNPNPENKEHFIARVGLSERENEGRRTASDDARRQAEHYGQENPPLDINADPAIAAFCQDRSAVRIIGYGDPAVLRGELRMLTARQLEQIAERWFYSEAPPGYCAFAEARDLAHEVTHALNALLDERGVRLRGAHGLIDHLSDGDRERLLEAIAEGAEITDQRITRAIEIGQAGFEASVARLQRRFGAEPRPVDPELHAVLTATDKAVEAKAALPPIANIVEEPEEAFDLRDLHRLLGEGDEQLGRQFAAASLTAGELDDLLSDLRAEGAVPLASRLEQTRARARTLINGR